MHVFSLLKRSCQYCCSNKLADCWVRSSVCLLSRHFSWVQHISTWLIVPPPQEESKYLYLFFLAPCHHLLLSTVWMWGKRYAWTKKVTNTCHGNFNMKPNFIYGIYYFHFACVVLYHWSLNCYTNPDQWTVVPQVHNENPNKMYAIKMFLDLCSIIGNFCVDNLSRLCVQEMQVETVVRTSSWLLPSPMLMAPLRSTRWLEKRLRSRFHTVRL